MVRSISAALLCIAIAPAQTQVTGGGVALQAAIDAASAGDTLIVAAATYGEIQVSKGITIICDPGVTLSAATLAIVDVNAIPAGETFVLRGANIVPLFPLTATAFIANCAGTVIFEAVSSNGATGITVQSCDQVAFHDVSVSLVTGDNSTVALVDCATTVSFTNSRVSLSSVALTAGGVMSGGALLFDCETFATDDVSPTTLYLVSGGTLRLDPTAQVNATVSLGSGAVVLTHEIPTVAAAPLVPGTAFLASTQFGAGQPGALVLGVPSPVVTTSIGDYWGGNVLLTLASAVAPASGILSASFPVPSSLSRGEIYVLHGAALDLSGLLRISPALVTAVR